MHPIPDPFLSMQRGRVPRLVQYQMYGRYAQRIYIHVEHNYTEIQNGGMNNL